MKVLGYSASSHTQGYNERLWSCFMAEMSPPYRRSLCSIVFAYIIQQYAQMSLGMPREHTNVASRAWHDRSHSAIAYMQKSLHNFITKRILYLDLSEINSAREGLPSSPTLPTSIYVTSRQLTSSPRHKQPTPS